MRYLHDNAAASDNLAGVAVLVNLAKPDHLAQLLVVLNLNISATTSWVPSQA